MTKPTLLVDADLIIFKACAAVEKEVRWDDDYHVLFSSPEAAWEVVQADLEKLSRVYPMSPVVFAITSTPNFRNTLVSEDYKSGRAGQRKPMCYAATKERLLAEYDVRSMPTLEADDVIGIMATRSKKPTVIVSIDKDMKTVPSRIYNWFDEVTVSPNEAMLFHMQQTLTGDVTDGYGGCPKVGPKTAEKLLDGAQTEEDAWSAVKQQYEKVGLTEDDAVTQARLARILQAPDWNAKKQEVILWQPPTRRQK